ncbi:MAG: hypothetical protein LUF92_15650 [Clostridiales bacterium]|nr:hypothetical protein [Clostridiales bacterium]
MLFGKEGKRNLFFLIIIVAGITILYLYSQPASTMTFEETSFSFSGPNNTSCSFSFDEIISISLEEDPDFGEVIDGGTSFGGNLYGTWESTSLGTYQAFASKKVSACIVISDADKTAVFNYENVETTTSVYESLMEYWKSDSE